VHHVPVEELSYDEIVVANVRAIRARRKLDQAEIVRRMRALGFTTWHRQTMGKIERGERGLLGPGEVLGLAAALETSIWALMAPGEDGEVKFPSGDRISARSVALSVLAYNDRSVTWDGDQPEFSAGEDDITAQVVIRPRSLFTSSPFGSSPADPAFGEGRAPLAEGPEAGQ